MRESEQPTRRQFLGRVGAAGAATLAAGAIGLEPLVGTQMATARAGPVGQGSNQRASQCAKLRRDAALENQQLTPLNLQHPTNADDDLYPDKIASYSKGLPHNDDGTVVLGAYQALTKALGSGSPADFDAIPLGGDRKLTNPQAGMAFDLQGADAQCLVQPPPPAFASRRQAAEIAENYWMAVLRDVPFARYGEHPAAHAAASDLSLFGADFGGGKRGGAVTPGTLFRGLTPGDLAGPYLSQFFYQPCRFGANELEQQITTVRSIAEGGADYMTDFQSWLAVQRGVNPAEADRLDPIRRYIRTGRDLGQWVHIDVLFQAYFQAFLVLASLGAAYDAGNPYNDNPTQIGFGTFGGRAEATRLRCAGARSRRLRIFI